jgi:diguanylate cyclase (GGDEF)-like protein
MQESLYDRFRPFKPYDLVLATTMIVLVAVSTRGSIMQQMLLIGAGLILFLALDFVQRLVPVPTPQWQALLIVAVNTVAVTILVHLRGATEFTLAFYMLNVGFATAAFGEHVGVASAALSVMAQLQLSLLTEQQPRRLVEIGLMLAVLLAIVAILTRINTMQEQAIFDVVTGLRNHRYFQVRLRDELKRSQRSNVPTGLIVLDLDNFKRVNDRFGHATGDAVLRKVAQTLERNARAADVVCRYGGEEMAVVLPGTSLADAGRVAERFRRAVEQLGEPEGQPVTVSVGVACYPQHGPSIDELLAAADGAMYQAKRAGKNCVHTAETQPKELTAQG